MKHLVPFTRRDLLATGLASIVLNEPVSDSGSVYVDLSGIRPGETRKIKSGDQAFIVRNRTPEQVSALRRAPVPPRDPQSDSQRTQRSEWLVVDARCTHMACPVQPLAGEIAAFRCFCHGSRYDLSGRVLSGPAPRNLAIPPYRFLSNSTVLIETNIYLRKDEK